MLLKRTFKYFWVLFPSNSNTEQKIDRTPTAVMWSVYRAIKVRRELSLKALFLIYWSSYNMVQPPAQLRESSGRSSGKPMPLLIQRSQLNWPSV